jgi:protein-tyrosine phosphatase
MTTFIIDFRAKNDPCFKEEIIFLANFNEKMYKLLLENKITIEKIISDYTKLKNATHIFLLFMDDEQVCKKIYLQTNLYEKFPNIIFTLTTSKELVSSHPKLLSLLLFNENSYFPMRSFSAILPNLYISDMFCAQNKQIVDLFQIKAIINVNASSAENVFSESLPYLSIFEEDKHSTDLKSYFSLTHRFIDKYLQIGGVLVHCAAGISRSSTIIIAYMMFKKRKTFAEAFQYVQDKHPITDPNLNFIIQLQQYEKELNI